MDSWNSIVMLADENGDGGGFFRILFFLIIAVVWILGVIGKKFAERKAEEERENRSRQRRANTDEALGEYEEPSGQEEDWEVVAPPPLPLVSEPQQVNLAGNIEPAMPSDTVLSHEKPSAAKLIRPRQKPAGLTSQPVPVPPPGSTKRRQSTDEAIRSHVSLASPEDARTAMTYYEIFAPPRALREELPRWET